MASEGLSGGGPLCRPHGIWGAAAAHRALSVVGSGRRTNHARSRRRARGRPQQRAPRLSRYQAPTPPHPTPPKSSTLGLGHDVGLMHSISADRAARGC